MTLEEARAQWRATTEGDGGRCPCCDRWGKIYGRNINKTMAAAVVWLFQQEGDENGWVHLPTKAPLWLMRSKQLPSMRWWGLIERKAKDPKDASARFSGFWRLTELGKQWVVGHASVPRMAWTYDGEVERLDGDPVTVSQCFDSYFDYSEVVAGRFDGLGA